MLNGKFYTGLPPKMIERSGGRNHQKTNFFWPDESNSKSVTDTKIKKTPINNCTDNSISPECEPQQLFKKQLTSKIQFYDLIDDDFKNKTINRNENVNNMKMIDKNYMKTKQPETFKSGAQDYDDYIDGGKYDKIERNIKMEIDRNITDLPKLTNKRITFSENDKKAHIKNNVNDKKPTILKQRVGLVNKNKSISKSVDNLPVKLLKNNNTNQDEDIHVIENDVKNLKLPFDEDYFDSREYEFDQRERGQRNSNSKNLPIYPREDKEIAIKEIRRPVNHQKHNYETNYENNGRQFSKFQQRNNYSHLDHKNFSNSNQDKDEYYPRERYNDDNNTRHIEIRLSPARELYEKGKINSNESEKRNHLSYKNNNKYEEISLTPKTHHHQYEEQHINRNRHLKSNIIFSDENDNHHSSVPERKTIRSSAVSRVSVGLPE